MGQVENRTQRQGRGTQLGFAAGFDDARARLLRIEVKDASLHPLDAANSRVEIAPLAELLGEDRHRPSSAGLANRAVGPRPATQRRIVHISERSIGQLSRDHGVGAFAADRFHPLAAEEDHVPERKRLHAAVQPHEAAVRRVLDELDAAKPVERDLPQHFEDLRQLLAWIRGDAEMAVEFQHRVQRVRIAVGDRRPSGELHAPVLVDSTKTVYADLDVLLEVDDRLWDLSRRDAVKEVEPLRPAVDGDADSHVGQLGDRHSSAADAHILRGGGGSLERTSHNVAGASRGQAHQPAGQAKTHLDAVIDQLQRRRRVGGRRGGPTLDRGGHRLTGEGQKPFLVDLLSLIVPS